MILCLSAPSKTFLAGEYAVLRGATALVLNTSPRFELQIRPGSGQITGIPSGSPAGLWLQQRQPLIERYDLHFHDPHEGRGGFGASGAQFLLVHSFTTFLQSAFSHLIEGVQLADLWQDQNVLSKGKGSGADVLAQTVGGVARVNANLREAIALSWPYPDLGFSIVRTQNKVATHEHLADIVEAQLDQLKVPADACVEAFGRRSAEDFVDALKIFAQTLNQLSLQTPTSREMCNHLLSQKWCLAAKGCGALGADTILFIYKKESQSSVTDFLVSKGWNCAASHDSLSGGLQLAWRGSHAH